MFVLHEAFGFATPRSRTSSAAARPPCAGSPTGPVNTRRRAGPLSSAPRIRQQVPERFVAAALGGDVATLMEILAPDVTLWTDGGGNARSALRPVQGRQKVARLLAGYASRPPRGLDVRYRRVNGDTSAVIFAEDAPYAVMVMDLTHEGDQVCDVFLVTNPEKLSAVERDEEAAPEASPRARDEDGTAGPLGAD